MTQNKKIEIIADKIKVNGPRLDNAYTVTLEVGEYEHGKIAQIMNISQPTNFKIIIEEIEKGEEWQTITPKIS